MKKAMALILVVLLAATVLFAKSINTGMDISKCTDPVVVDFINYMVNQDIMDAYFNYYSIGLDDTTGEYYVSLTPIGSEYSNDVILYFFDDNVEMFWYSDYYVNEENYLLILYLINDFTSSYANWATVFVDEYYGDCLASTSIMSTTGIQNYGEAIWYRLELFINLSDAGFYDIVRSLAEYLNLN